MINHTRCDALVFLLCGQLTTRWRDSNTKLKICTLVGNLNTKDQTPNRCFITQSQVVVNCIFFLFMLLVALDHKACFFLSFFLCYSDRISGQQPN